MLEAAELTDQLALIDQARTLGGVARDRGTRGDRKREQVCRARHRRQKRAGSFDDLDAKWCRRRPTRQSQLGRRRARCNQVTLGDDARALKPGAQEHQGKQVEERGQPKHMKS